MKLNPILAAVLFLPLLVFAEENIEKRPRLSQHTPITQEKKNDKPSSPILDHVFKASLNQDQLKTLGGNGWTKLKGNQGWRDESGRIWKKDQLHKDHWDIMDRKGKKV